SGPLRSSRKPFFIGSMVGVSGTCRLVFRLSRSSVGGAPSFDSARRGLCSWFDRTLVQGSHASPIPSPSLSVWVGLATSGQLSSASHTPSPSVSGVPVSAGQSIDRPVQTSGTSHALAEGRQTKPALCSESAGHIGPVPLHISARSQRPAAGRHTPG